MNMELAESKNSLVQNVLGYFENRGRPVLPQQKDKSLALYGLYILHWNDEDPATGIYKVYEDHCLSYTYGGFRYIINSDATEVCVKVVDINRILEIMKIEKKPNYIPPEDVQEEMRKKAINYKYGDFAYASDHSDRLVMNLLSRLYDCIKITLEPKEDTRFLHTL